MSKCYINETLVNKTGSPVVEIIYGITSLILLGMGSLGNTLVILSIAFIGFKKRFGAYLISLAVADLLVVLFVPAYQLSIPLFVKKANLTTTELNGSCKVFIAVTNYIEFWLLMSSILNLVAISSVRLAGTNSSLEERLVQTHKSAKKPLILAWTLSAALAVPIALFPSKDPVLFRYPIENKKNWMIDLYKILIMFTLPSARLIYCGVRICQNMRMRRDDTNLLRPTQSDVDKRQNVIRLVIWVLIVFLFCWIPFTIYYTALMFFTCDLNSQESRSRCWLSSLSKTTFLLVMSKILPYLNSCVNPIIYGLVSSDFREAYRRTLSCGRSTTVRNTTILTRRHEPERIELNRMKH